MAEVNANSLPAKTDLGTNDSAIVVDQTTNAGALVDLDVLADKVLDRITSKTFANQVGGSSAATLLAQLSTLNSNMMRANDMTYFTGSQTIQDRLDALNLSMGSTRVYRVSWDTMQASGGPSLNCILIAFWYTASTIMCVAFPQNATNGMYFKSKINGTWDNKWYTVTTTQYG